MERSTSIKAASPPAEIEHQSSGLHTPTPAATAAQHATKTKEGRPTTRGNGAGRGKEPLTKLPTAGKTEALVKFNKKGKEGKKSKNVNPEN